MKKHLRLNSPLLIFGIPILILVTSLFLALNLASFTGQESIMATAITIDMVIVAPILYLILIYRTQISKLTVTPFFVISLLLASFVIPQSHHNLIDFILLWILPCIELVIFGIVAYSVFKLRKTFKAQRVDGEDFLSLIRKSTLSVFPPKLAYALAMEISLFYYTFFAWKKRTYLDHEFTYHKDSGIRMILVVLLVVSLVELFCVHLLLQDSYPILTWILSGVSIYGLIQIMGMIKSIPRTPIKIENNELIVRMAIFSETRIPLHAIESIEFTMRDYPKEDKTYRKLAILDYNCIVHLNSKQTIIGLFGIQKEYNHLVISIDDKERFKTAIEQHNEI